jgi:hypothetical protein
LLVTAARERAGLVLMLLGAGCAAEHAPQRVADNERERAAAERDDAGSARGAEPEPPAPAARAAEPDAASARIDASEPAPDDAAPSAATDATDPPPATDAQAVDAARAADARAATPTRAHCLRDGEDYAMPGAYPVSSWEVELDSLDPELAARGHRETFTIFQPTVLEADCPHPAVIWGNDRTLPGPNSGLLEHFASWGFVAVGAHSPNVTEAHFSAALAFLEEQRNEPDSRLYGKLGELVALAGQGASAVAASLSSAHPEVASVLCVRDCRAPAPGVGLLCLTSTIDTSGACSAAFDAAEGPAFVAAHVLGTEQGPVDGRLSTAWLRCQLDGDAQACALFRLEGDCILCDELGTWHDMRAKNL